MHNPTCLWDGCDRPAFARGLCQRCGMRARRAGTISQFEAPPRVCDQCGSDFRTGKNGKHRYCSTECQVASVAARREARRVAELTRPCQRCGSAVSHTQRSDAKYCSVTCQQAVWYEANDEMLKARAGVWKKSNREMAKDSDHRRRALVRGNRVGRISYDEVWVRDKGMCWICGEMVDPDLPFPDPRSRSIDHIIPIVAGGAHAMDNVALSHLRCNISKKSKILDRLPSWASQEVVDAMASESS